MAGTVRAGTRIRAVSLYQGAADRSALPIL